MSKLTAGLEILLIFTLPFLLLPLAACFLALAGVVLGVEYLALAAHRVLKGRQHPGPQDQTRGTAGQRTQCAQTLGG